MDMNDKEKQIEEKTCKNCIHYNICALWTTTDLEQDEAHKYCYHHWQPELPKGSVVLYHDEAQKYYAYKIIEPQIKGCLDRELALEKQLKEARKQAVKEVLEKTKEKCKELEDKFSHLCKSKKECLMETCRYEGVLAVKRELNEIAKEFGVEL